MKAIISLTLTCFMMLELGNVVMAQGPALRVTVVPASGVLNPGESATLTVDSQGTANSYLWKPGGETTTTITVSPMYTTVYRVIGYNSQNNTSDSIDVTITVNAEMVLDIPNVITPNGDGWNDRLEIPGLNTYLENEIVIYNRWNTIVYQKKGYTNDWDGLGLSGGVYYYFLKLKRRDGDYAYQSGYVHIIR